MATIAPFDPVSLTSIFNGGVTTVSRALLQNQGTAQQLAAKRVESIFTGRVNDAKAALFDPTTAATLNLLREKSQLVSRNSRIGEALSVLGKAQDQFTYLSSAITYLQDQITALENGDITASQLATTFDNKLHKINDLVDAASVTYSDGGKYFTKNLLASTSRLTYGTQSLVAPYNSTTDTVQVSGVYLGTDYYITDSSSGNVYLSDTGYLSNDAATGTLSEYSSYPGSPTGVSTSVDNITLNSFDSSTGAVQFTSAATGTVNGTVTRGGLGLLDSFLYDNFNSADGISRAKADLQNAEALVLNTQASFRATATTLQTRSDLFNTQILGLDQQVANQVQNVTDAGQAKLLSTQIQFSIAQFDFALLASRGNGIVQSLVLSQDGSNASDSSVFSSAVTGALVSITA